MNTKRWRRAQEAEYILTHKYSFSDPKSTEARRMARVAKFFLASPSDFENKVIADIGCGYNGLIFYMSMAKIRVGLEPLALKIKELIPPRSKKGVSLVCGMGEELPFKSSSFDIVISDNALDHSLDPKAFIREIMNCLRTGGFLYLRVNTFHQSSPARKLLSLIDKPHPYHFSDKEIRGLLDSKGLKLVHHASQSLTLRSAILDKIKLRRIFSAVKFGIALLFGLKYSYFVAQKTTSNSD